MNSSYDLVEEDFIHETSLTISPVTCCKKVCRVLPTPVCRNNLLRMRHERTCHVFKGFVGKCAVCGEKFTTSKLIWNAIKLWNDQCSVNNCQFNLKVMLYFRYLRSKLILSPWEFLMTWSMWAYMLWSARRSPARHLVPRERLKELYKESRGRASDGPVRER